MTHEDKVDPPVPVGYKMGYCSSSATSNEKKEPHENCHSLMYTCSHNHTLTTNPKPNASAHENLVTSYHIVALYANCKNTVVLPFRVLRFKVKLKEQKRSTYPIAENKTLL